MRFIGVACFVALVLTGCAPLIPSFETKRGDRVGILVDIGNNPVHTHEGTTFFTNFEKKYPYQWHLDSAVTEVPKNSLSKAGFAVIDLETDGLRYSDVTSLIVWDGEKWKPGPGKENTVRELVERRGLRAVVVVKETPIGIGGSVVKPPHSANASGLYTDGSLDTQYKAVAAFRLNVYVLNPLANISEANPLLIWTIRKRVTPLTNFPAPANFEQITEAEFLPVRDVILKFSEQMAVEIAKALNPK